MWVTGGAGLERKTDADVTADLADKDRLSFIPHRASPKPQMVAFVDIMAGLLAGEFLVPAVKVERAHGGIPVAGPKQE